ncbi:DUF2950 family protein [Teichococcus oryzae]|uniref:DUF2950 family protein n=1 Tax=Teichococcus oryzae TaxID=1608942 RepID=UPI001F501666|nr:DUF2950 family protein [Pseudoroseomonas oryzae]
MPAPDPARREAPQATPRPVPPRAFRTPEEGFAALANAIRGHDERRLIQVLGGEARRLIRSGDPAADRAARERFASAYAERAEILHPDANRATLEIGNDRWPFPIPMIRRVGQAGSWRFDARQGAQELIDRRIGRNELDTIEVLRAIVAAQSEYAVTVGRQGGFSVYARRIFSTPGTHDGLYWPSKEGQPESPLGPLAAAASAGGYGGSPASGDAPQPFHGYIFRLLEAQGPAAGGGAMDYVVGRRMIGGFGVLATPAEYGVSGIQTFMTSHAGVIYQRNLGPATNRIARSIQTFNPEPGWEEVRQ